MPLEGIMVSEICQRQMPIFFTCMWNPTNKTNEYTQKCLMNRNRLTDIVNKLMVTNRKSEVG